MGANAVKKGKRTMANLMDYLDWRGDLLLENAPFNEVDNLILAELSFLDFTGIVGDGSGGGSIALKDAVDAWFLRHEGELPRMGVLVPAQIIPMADKRSMHLMRAEVPGPTVGKLLPKLRDTAKILYILYLLLSLILFVQLAVKVIKWFTVHCYKK